MRKGSIDQARSNFQMAQKLAPYLFEPYYNASLLAYKLGDFQESFELVKKGITAYPDHSDSQELLKQLATNFNQI